MTIDRTQAPKIKLPQTIAPLAARDIVLSNGMPLYIINSGDADVVRLSFVFNAGTRYQPQFFVARAVAQMLCEGSQKYSAAQIADILEFYYSSMETDVDPDWSCVSFYSLGKYFEKTMEIAEDIIKHPLFDEEKLSNYLRREKQKYELYMSKNSYLSRCLFDAAIYGKSHMYGCTGKPEDFDKLNVSILNDFYKKCYSSANAYIVLAGKVSPQIIDCVTKFFGNQSWGNPSPEKAVPTPLQPSSEKFIFKEKIDCKQTTLRLGAIAITKTHPDFYDLALTLFVLGGYFGSRLMKNIREDKGYTYGIYTNASYLRDYGSFCIAAEVGNDYVRQTIEEIKNEILRLQNEKIEKDELSLVKNFLVGSTLRGIDGAWNMADMCIDIKNMGLDYTYPQQIFEKCMHVKPERIMEMAKKYLEINNLTQVIVGRY